MSGKGEKVSFEDALDMTDQDYVPGFGRFNLVIILLSIGVILAMAFETFSVSYLVPASACELQTTNFQQGLMAGMPLFGILAGSNLLGYMADTRGRRKTLLWALSFGYISGSLATLSPNWIAFSFLKFLSSSAMAGSYGLGVSYLSECTPESKRSSIVILITSAFLVSVGTMAALTIPVLALTFSYYVPYLDIHFNGWRLLNLIYATPCLLCAISLYFAFESPKFYLSTGQGDKALEIMKKMFVINTGRSSEDFKVQEVYLEEDCASSLAKGFWGSIAAQTTPLLKPPLLKNTLLLSVLFVAVYFCFNPYTVWLPYMADGFMKSLEKGERGLTFCQMLRSSENETSVRDPESTADCALNAKAMTLVLAIDLLLAVINIVLAAIKHWVSRKTLLIGVQMSAGVAGLGLVFCNIWQLTAVLLVTYVAGNLNFGILSTFSVDIFPTYVKAMGVCLTLMVGRGSAVFSISLLKGMLVSNCEGSFYLYTCITFFGGLIGLLLPGEKQKVNKNNVAEANTIGAT